MMMGPVAITILALALAGAAASWVVGAVASARGLAERGLWPWLRAAFAWPFALGRLRSAAADQASLGNKAIVALFVCLMVAMATISLSTNYNRFAR